MIILVDNIIREKKFRLRTNDIPTLRNETRKTKIYFGFVLRVA